MIEIPESSELQDLERKLEAVCRHLKIRLIAETDTLGFRYHVKAGFRAEPLHREKLDNGEKEHKVST